jgi:hypothetical protein
MQNFPAVGTVVCGCDEDAACTYHAGMLYAKESYEPTFSDICTRGPDGDNCLECPTCRM